MKEIANLSIVESTEHIFLFYKKFKEKQNICEYNCSDFIRNIVQDNNVIINEHVLNFIPRVRSLSINVKEEVNTDERSSMVCKCGINYVAQENNSVCRQANLYFLFIPSLQDVLNVFYDIYRPNIEEFKKYMGINYNCIVECTGVINREHFNFPKAKIEETRIINDRNVVCRLKKCEPWTFAKIGNIDKK